MSMSYKQIQDLHLQVLQDMNHGNNNATNETITNIPYQDFITVFSRDDKIGLGIQLREYHGQIIVHAVSDMNGNWLDSIQAVDGFLEMKSSMQNEKKKILENTYIENYSLSSFSMDNDDNRNLLRPLMESNKTRIMEDNTPQQSSYYEDNKSELLMMEDDMIATLGPAANAGILPGDCIIGVHGQGFDKVMISSSSSLLLTHVSEMIRHSTDPIILHIRRYNYKNTDSLLGLFQENHGGEAIEIDPTTELSTTNLYEKNPIMARQENGTTYPRSPTPCIDNLIQSSRDIMTHQYTPVIRNVRGRIIRQNRKKLPNDNYDYESHPFVRLLVKKGIIQHAEDESQVLSELFKITERAQLWDSIQSNTSTTNAPFFEGQTKTRPQTFHDSSILLYPATAKSRQTQSILLNHDGLMIKRDFTTINKALSIRIVDSFLDGDKVAYTIWIYDVEKREEWYAPIRYTHDFVELREVTSRMSKYVETIDFPSLGWFSTLTSTEVSESQSSRDMRCSRLEAFLRELFKAIYLHPLTPNSAEVALYVQSFLGVDSYKERLIHFSPNFYVTNKISIEEDTIRSRLQIAIQLYVYRIFLIGVMCRLVDTFISDIRGSFISVTITRDLLENTLRKIKSFLHQTQMLIFDGCINDFRRIMVHLECTKDDSKGDRGHDNEETLLHEAIRSQVEVEVYIPIRSLISKHLTTLYRDDDIEILRKMEHLKQYPQSYFIPHGYESPSEWKAVSEILTIGLARQSLPCIKLKSIVNTGLSIPHLFEIEHHPNESKPFTADIMLPIFIYAVLHADIDRPHALCALLRNICDPSTEIGIEGYYLSTFEASVAHIMELGT